MTKQRKAQPEFELQKQVAEYLRLAYPRVMFLSDVRAAMKLTIPQAVRSKKIQADNFACPDMVIFEPSGNYHGLFMELKASSPYLKNGQLTANAHIREQANALNRLRDKGFRAEFVWSFEMAREIIDEYLR